jgi:single-strand DNA-binding protein
VAGSQLSLRGNLGGDPDVRDKITTLNVAINEGYKDRNNEWVNKTIWVKVICFKRAAEIAASMRKGDAILVMGKLDFNSYENRDGVKINELRVVADEVFQVIKFEKDDRSSRDTRDDRRRDDRGGRERYDQRAERRDDERRDDRRDSRRDDRRDTKRPADDDEIPF